jgi:hypothetical protein
MFCFLADYSFCLCEYILISIYNSALYLLNIFLSFVFVYLSSSCEV